MASFPESAALTLWLGLALLLVGEAIFVVRHIAARRAKARRKTSQTCRGSQKNTAAASHNNEP